MFGYAINATPELMPLPIALAHRLSRRLTEVRKNGVLPYLRPDGKTQVTIAYEDNVPVRLDTVVISTQHAADIDLEKTLDPDIREKVLNTVLDDLAHETLDASTVRVLVNPTGKFVLGGPMGDAGLTGRKIIVDTYGGWARHGGGAFSGKDPSKVDRSAAYAMRWVAKNVVAAGLAERVEVQVAYAIGKAAPVGLFVETFGTETEDPVKIEKAIGEVFDLRPGAIIRDLNLLRPIYAPTAAYGHFGRTDVELPWEQLDKVDDLKRAIWRRGRERTQNRTRKGFRVRFCVCSALAADAVVAEVEPPAAPVGFDRGGRAQRDVTVLVEVIAVGQPTTVLPEDLAVPAAHHLREIASVGFFGHLDAGGAGAAGSLQAPDDVVCLRLDEREVRRPDVAVRSEHGEEVRVAGNADALIGLQPMLVPEPAQGRTASSGDGIGRDAVGV